jgi:hypothetical protein
MNKRKKKLSEPKTFLAWFIILNQMIIFHSILYKIKNEQLVAITKKQLFFVVETVTKKPTCSI